MFCEGISQGGEKESQKRIRRSQCLSPHRLRVLLWDDIHLLRVII